MDRVLIPGETFTITNSYVGYVDFGMPRLRWRKDGQPITSWESFVADNVYFAGGRAVLTLTNVQPADAGVYDMEVDGNYWYIDTYNKINVSVQFRNGQGVFGAPRVGETNFVCEFEGVPGRGYAIQASPDLSSWASITTLYTTDGTATLTNGTTSGTRFYRAMLLP